jgi:hypothetical protein
MTSFLSRLRRPVNVFSVIWRDSSTVEGVRFATKRISLGQRIEFARQILELTAKNEFLKAGNVEEQLEANLADLLVKRLYLEWGLAEISGLRIDGELATPSLLAERGPEYLSDEIIGAIREETELSEDERKN